MRQVYLNLVMCLSHSRSHLLYILYPLHFDLSSFHFAWLPHPHTPSSCLFIFTLKALLLLSVFPTACAALLPWAMHGKLGSLTHSLAHGCLIGRIICPTCPGLKRRHAWSAAGDSPKLDACSSGTFSACWQAEETHFWTFTRYFLL